MFWQVNYVIDTGINYDKHLCVVRAKTVDDALEVAHEYAEKEQLGYDDVLLKEYTVATKLPTEGVIYSR